MAKFHPLNEISNFETSFRAIKPRPNRLANHSDQEKASHFPSGWKYPDELELWKTAIQMKTFDPDSFSR